MLYWNSERHINSIELLNHITEQMHDPVLVINDNGWIIGANAAVMRLTSWSIKEITESKFDASKNSCFFDWKNSGKCCRQNLEMFLQQKDGVSLRLHVNAVFTYLSQWKVAVAVLRQFPQQQEEYIQNLLTKYIIRAQEDERKRVSRELHDELGQNLYSVLIGLQVLAKEASSSSQIQDLQQMVARSLDMLKNIAVELRPSTLDDLGLAAAIRSFMKRFEQTYGIEGQLTINGVQRRYEPEIETALYRICQEAMINAAKYAKVAEVHISLQDFQDHVNLIVEDKGIGFDICKLEDQGTSLGLYGMKERAQLIGGRVDIVSQVNYGTSVRASIPIDEKGGFAMPIKILIGDDHAIVRSGLTMLINSHDDMEVVGTAAEGRETFDMAMKLKPDIILLDLSMPPGENGLSATIRIKDAMPEIKILILTMHDDEEYIFKILQAGASGYILKSALDNDLMNAIRTIYQGNAYLCPGITKTLIHEFVQKPSHGSKDATALTVREQNFLSLMALGYSNKEIAEELSVSVKTVESYRAKIMDKLNLKTRHELVRYAFKKGLMDLE